MTKFWMAVASKEHVQNGVRDGFSQACHGKAAPLRRMKVGDGIIYYSPKVEFGTNIPCQEFTGIGVVTGENVYSFDMGGGFVPFRRDVTYEQNAHPASIKPLIPHLNFIENKHNWGAKFRFGFFEIPREDYNLIKDRMCINQNIASASKR